MHDGTFQKIDDDDESALGPTAILVSGFSQEVGDPLGAVLRGIDATDHRVLFCTPEMIKQPLGQALDTQTQSEPAKPDTLPRVMILSGFTGAQLQGFISGYKSSGLPRPIFASVTPINLEFPVGKLIMELLREQRAMRRRH